MDLSINWVADFPPLTTASSTTVQSVLELSDNSVARPLFTQMAGSLQESAMEEVSRTRRPRRPRQPVVGAAASKTSLQSVKTKRTTVLFVSRLHPHTSGSEITECVDDILGGKLQQ